MLWLSLALAGCVLVRTLKYLPCQLKLPSGHLCNKCWVHFDNEVHLGKMHQKVHLAKMHRLYVGIRKNHMDQIKKNQKVHLAEMHFLVLFLKVGLFAPEH